MLHNPIHIENDRLLICNLNNRDLNGLEALRCDQKVYTYEPTFLIELQGLPETALETIQKMDLYENRQCILGVYERTDPSVLIGLAEFYDYKPSGKIISIGYRFLSNYWGKGIASSCISALLEYIQNNTNIKQVFGIALAANKASRRVLEKCGFELIYEGDGLYQGSKRKIIKTIKFLKYSY